MDRRIDWLVLASVVIVGGVAVLGAAQFVGTDADMTEQWISDTGVPSTVNHHAPAVALIDGDPLVFAPVSGEGNSDQCALVAIDGHDGTSMWAYPIPPEHCTVHAVADPTVGSLPGDGRPVVIAATTERAVTAFDVLTGEIVVRHELSSYGYTQPIVADLDGTGTASLVVVDALGEVSVIDADGTVRWQDRLDGYTWAQPTVADLSGDRRLEVLVASGGGMTKAYHPNGSVLWARSLEETHGRVTWTTTVDPPDRVGTDVVVATRDGIVARLRGSTGETVWQHDFGEFAAVHAVADGDGDGVPNVYAVARDGVLRSIAADDGTLEWTTTLTTDDVQMTPPPSIGDLNGDGTLELVAPTQPGAVSVVDPETGEILGTYERAVPIYVHPVLADTTGDGAEEIYVMYADGRVVLLEYSG